MHHHNYFRIWAAVACAVGARVDVEILQEAYEVHISCAETDTRKGEDSGPAVTEDITAFQEKKNQRRVLRVALMKVGRLLPFEISQEQVDFPNWPDGNPCHFRRAKTI